MTPEAEAMRAYVLLSIDTVDFIEYVDTISSEGREILDHMLTQPNPSQSTKDRDLNKFGADLLVNR